MRAFMLALLAVELIAMHAWLIWSDGQGGPDPRAGHSLHVYNNTVIIFGGRSNEKPKLHDPRTYKIAKSDGKLFFETYTGRHVKECLAEDGTPLDPDAVSDEVFHRCYDVQVGTYWNDVWSYWLGCERDGDKGCATDGWRELSTHVDLGGCKIIKEQYICSHPNERWEHSAAVLAIPPNTTQGAGYGLMVSPPSDGAGGPTNVDGLLMVYGGYAQLCEDYCSDMWAFPVSLCSRNSTQCDWVRMATLNRDGPGKRWRGATASDGLRWVVYGGHRLWHGYAPENDLRNKWASETKYPFGGYLDDLWLFGLHPKGLGATLYNRTRTGLGTVLKSGAKPTAYTARELVLDSPIATDPILIGDTVVQGAWQQIIPRESCYSAPGSSWRERRDISCTILWPSARGNAAIVLAGELLYLYGGYATAFPYPHVLGRGSGPGVGSLSSDSRSPYPTGPYYMGDMWLFDWRTGTWEEIQPLGDVSPTPRARHSIILAGNVLLMFGGYAQNTFYRDLWFYNLTNGKWLEKDYYPYPIFPESCFTDVVWDPDLMEEVPIMIKDPADPSGVSLIQQKSVSGEPTRGKVLDGMFGRASWNVSVKQTRRQAPFWDGCRDRADGRKNLPSELQYIRPMQRAGHAAAYSPVTGEMLVFGGETLEAEQQPGVNFTWNTLVTGDLWAWRRDLCPKGCSQHGDCWYGHCYCREGYYGIDCSNITCPGTYCSYNTETHKQSCQHCCSSPYNHTDGDMYLENQRKVACGEYTYGQSHGICDGFGFCQCEPPFLAEDCSVKDCPGNCSNHGWCSVEYPVSRCMCKPPWTGNNCSIIMCLNNCSYPNGVCQEGLCDCSTIPSPYNKSLQWGQFEGDDCSWMQPFAGAPAGAMLQPSATIILIAATIVLIARALQGQP